MLGYGDRSTAKALEAKIDNTITAIASELVVFMGKTYRCFQFVSTTRPPDFPMPLKEGSRIPLQREVYSEQNRGQRPWLQPFRGEDGFRIGAGNFAHGNPPEATNQRAD